MAISESASMKPKLHKTQTAILKAIKSDPNITVRGLQKAVKISSTSVVDYHLNKLMAHGYIRKGNKWEIMSNG